MKKDKQYKRTRYYSKDEVENNFCDWVPKSTKFKDITGVEFGNLKAIKIHKRETPHTFWFCECTCGNIISCTLNQLSSNKISCTTCSMHDVGQRARTNPRDRLRLILRKFPQLSLLTNESKRWLFWCNKCKTRFVESQSEMICDRYKGTPCRCDNGVKFMQWNTYLREKQISDRCKEINAEFVGWVSEEGYKTNTSRLVLSCNTGRHKDWTVNVNNFISSYCYGCPQCSDETKNLGKRNDKEDLVARGTTIHGGKFLYDNFEYIDSRTPSSVFCTVCMKSFDVSYDNHINKLRGCPYEKGRNQKQGYIILIKDGQTPVAVKYGIATNSYERFNTHVRSTIFNLELVGVWEFDNSLSCKYSERYIKDNVNGSVLSSREFTNNTETTCTSNTQFIIGVFESHGGIKSSVLGVDTNVRN